jgi:hypothetical protein
MIVGFQILSCTAAELSDVPCMRTLTVRLPDALVSERESRVRNVSKSDVVRERLRQPHRPDSSKRGTMRELAGDLIGSVEGLPSDLASNKKSYLPALIRAKKLHRR